MRLRGEFKSTWNEEQKIASSEMIKRRESDFNDMKNNWKILRCIICNDVIESAFDTLCG